MFLKFEPLTVRYFRKDCNALKLNRLHLFEIDHGVKKGSCGMKEIKKNLQYTKMFYANSNIILERRFFL